MVKFTRHLPSPPSPPLPLPIFASNKQTGAKEGLRIRLATHEYVRTHAETFSIGYTQCGAHMVLQVCVQMAWNSIVYTRQNV